MYLKKIQLDHWGCHDDLQIDFHEGLNVCVGPNGAGKSTLYHAIVAALTVKHDATGQRVAAFKSWGKDGFGPTATLEIVRDEVVWNLTKSYLFEPRCLLERNGGQAPYKAKGKVAEQELDGWLEGDGAAGRLILTLWSNQNDPIQIFQPVPQGAKAPSPGALDRSDPRAGGPPRGRGAVRLGEKRGRGTVHGPDHADQDGREEGERPRPRRPGVREGRAAARRAASQGPGTGRQGPGVQGPVGPPRGGLRCEGRAPPSSRGARGPRGRVPHEGRNVEGGRRARGEAPRALRVDEGRQRPARGRGEGQGRVRGQAVRTPARAGGGREGPGCGGACVPGCRAASPIVPAPPGRSRLVLRAAEPPGSGHPEGSGAEGRRGSRPGTATKRRIGDSGRRPRGSRRPGKSRRARVSRSPPPGAGGVAEEFLAAEEAYRQAEADHRRASESALVAERAGLRELLGKLRAWSAALAALDPSGDGGPVPSADEWQSLHDEDQRLTLLERGLDADSLTFRLVAQVPLQARLSGDGLDPEVRDLAAGGAFEGRGVASFSIEIEGVGRIEVGRSAGEPSARMEALRHGRESLSARLAALGASDVAELEVASPTRRRATRAPGADLLPPREPDDRRAGGAPRGTRRRARDVRCGETGRCFAMRGPSPALRAPSPGGRGSGIPPPTAGRRPRDARGGAGGLRGRWRRVAPRGGRPDHRPGGSRTPGRARPRRDGGGGRTPEGGRARRGLGAGRPRERSRQAGGGRAPARRGGRRGRPGRGPRPVTVADR